MPNKLNVTVYFFFMYKTHNIQCLFFPEVELAFLKSVHAFFFQISFLEVPLSSTLENMQGKAERKTCLVCRRGNRDLI